MGLTLAYNIAVQTPLTTYGEVPIQYSQLLLLILVTAWFSGHCDIMGVGVPFASVLMLVTAMGARLVPLAVTMWLYGICAFLGAFGVVPQLLMNYRRKSTGQLSFVVVAMGLCGCTTRVFTTWMEVADPVITFVSLLNWLVAASLVSQFLLYWHLPSDVGTID